MKAIVLSRDKYGRLTDQMLRIHERSWLSKPFTFQVPYRRHQDHLRK